MSSDIETGGCSPRTMMDSDQDTTPGATTARPKLRCAECGDVIEREPGSKGRPPVVCKKKACWNARHRRQARVSWRRRNGAPESPLENDAAPAQAADQQAGPCPYLGIVRESGIPMADCDECARAETCAVLPPRPVAVPLTADQVAALLAVGATSQGILLPNCATCARLRTGRPGSPVAGYLHCLKDELVCEDLLDQDADASGRAPIVEDRRSGLSAYWLREDVAHMGSARHCRYRLLAPATTATEAAHA